MAAKMAAEVKGRVRENIISGRIFWRIFSGLAGLIILGISPGLAAWAAPATLGSSSATIYEQPSEESNAVGNLVQDGAFEYLGDVEAEDGIWHQVSVGGVSGYIKGEVVINDENAGGGPEEASEEGEGAEEAPTEEEPEQAPMETATVQQQQPEPAGDTEMVSEEDAEEMPTEEGEDELPEEGDDLLAVPPMQNNRAKTYAAEASEGKIKALENAGGLEKADSVEGADGNRKAYGIDGTLILSIVMTVLFAIIARFFWRKLKSEYWKADGQSEHILNGTHKKNDKKRKRNRHRKNRKKTKNKKEIVKTQKIIK